MGAKRFPIPFEGQKVVYASEMVRIEKKAIAEKDAQANTYMLRVADHISEIVLNYIQEKNLPSQVILLCGKGNNGGDGYAVGEKLLDENLDVVAYQLVPLSESSELCQMHAKLFEEKGGTIHQVGGVEEVEFPEGALVLDALLGTGSQGEVQGLFHAVIEKLNGTENPVIAIDIPSGVNGETGFAPGVAVQADLTLYVGFLKVGHLYNQGFDYVGDLLPVELGLEDKYILEAKEFGFVVNPETVRKNLPCHKRTVNKYDVGQVVLIAGSPGMPGAAILASTAALKSGAGMVRLFHPSTMGAELCLCPPEVVRHGYGDLEVELRRTQAVLVGSGIGRSNETKELLEKVYKMVQCPLVIDGDALFFFQGGVNNAILTPHKGELRRLLQVGDKLSDLELLAKAEEYAALHKVVIVFKGAPTTVIAPGFPKVIIPYGNKGMASAGMGDALAGIIASFLAQGEQIRDAAILGATVHALAGDQAKEIKSEYGMIASDLIDALSLVFQANT